MKKRERTVNLVHESEVLETQNVDLKTQVRDLEAQRRKLLDVLQSHGTNCVHQGGYQPLPSLSTLRTCKFLSDLSMSEQQQRLQHHQHQQHQQQQNDEEQTEIKYSHTLKANEMQQDFTKSQQHQQPLPNANHILPGYCKTSPNDDMGYVMSPDSGFVKSPSDLDVNGYPSIKDYIPNCENTSTPNQDFLLKNELIDSSPYTTVQSADRFLFENSDNLDRLTPGTASIKDHHIHHHMEYTGNFDGTILSKADFLSQHTEYLSLADTGVEPQFTDLDSGVTTYTNMTNGGCLA
jgi:activating transcription factor 3